MSGRRDPYRDVCAAMRQAITRAAGAKLTAGEHRTFEAVLVVTGTWSIFEAEIHVAQICAISGVSERSTRDHLVKLAGDLGIIDWEPRRGKRRDGTGLTSRLGLPAEGLTGSLVRPVKSSTGKKVNRKKSRWLTGSPVLPIIENYENKGSTKENPEDQGTLGNLGNLAAFGFDVVGAFLLRESA